MTLTKQNGKIVISNRLSQYWPYFLAGSLIIGFEIMLFSLGGLAPATITTLLCVSGLIAYVFFLNYVFGSVIIVDPVSKTFQYRTSSYFRSWEKTLPLSAITEVRIKTGLSIDSWGAYYGLFFSTAEAANLIHAGGEFAIKPIEKIFGELMPFFPGAKFESLGVVLKEPDTKKSSN